MAPDPDQRDRAAPAAKPAPDPAIIGRGGYDPGVAPLTEAQADLLAWNVDGYGEVPFITVEAGSVVVLPLRGPARIAG